MANPILSRHVEFRQHLDQCMPFRIPIDLLNLITSYVFPPNGCRVESRSVNAKRLEIVAVKSHLFYGNDDQSHNLYPINENDLRNKNFDWSLCPAIKITKPEWLYRENLWCIVDSKVWAVWNAEGYDDKEPELEMFTIDSNGLTHKGSPERLTKPGPQKSFTIDADCTSMCSVHQHKQVWLQTAYSRNVETGKYRGPVWNSSNNGYPIEVINWLGEKVHTMIPSHCLIDVCASMAFDGRKYVWLIDGWCKVIFYDAQTFALAPASETARISKVLLEISGGKNEEIQILPVQNEMWIFMFEAGLVVVFDTDLSLVLTRSFPKHQRTYHDYVCNAFVFGSDVYVQSNNTLTRIY